MLLFSINGFPTQLILFFLSLSILIILHELGHFIPAKLFGTRVHKFYLFFDFLFPFPGIANFSLFKKKIGDTEYGLGWFPFGGYVQIAGMADETQDAEALKNTEPQPWEFRSKPAWQRLIIMIGGVTMNMILAMLIYAMIFSVWGKKILPMKNTKGGIMIVDSLGYELGLKTGDKLIAANNKPFEFFDDFKMAFALENVNDIEILRNDSTIHLKVPEGFTSKVTKLKGADFVIPRFPAVVNNPYTKESKAAGFLKGDRIIAINNNNISYLEDLSPALDSFKNVMTQVKVIRKGKEVLLNAKTNENGKLGIQLETDPLKVLDIEVKRYNFFAALPLGVKEAFGMLGKYVKSIGTLIKSKEHKLKDSVGGFGSMIGQLPTTFDWEFFWYFTAFVSVALAFMNILPIPMLDGGYVLFLIYEMIFRKPLPEKVQNVLQNFGLIFILGLLLVTNGLDVAKSQWLNDLIHFFQNLFK